MTDPRLDLIRLYGEILAAREDLLAAVAGAPELAGFTKLAEVIGRATVLAETARRCAALLTEIERLHPQLWQVIGAAEGVLLRDIGREAILCRLWAEHTIGVKKNERKKPRPGPWRSLACRGQRLLVRSAKWISCLWQNGSDEASPRNDRRPPGD